MSVFENMDDEAGDFSEPTEKFTVEFGVESVDIPLGRYATVFDAFKANSEFLGFDTDRMLTYRNDLNDLLEGGEQPVAGRIYTAAITHDTKGL